MRETGLEGYFDAVLCAHDFGLPKENPAFWPRLQKVFPFDASRTLLVDDSLPVLRSARAHGIAHLRAIRRPDSRQPEKDGEEFIALESFDDIMPGGVMGNG
jgi:putative hydrolase of the HAD superfamily